MTTRRQLLDRLGQIVEAVAKANPPSTELRRLQHQIRRERAESLTARELCDLLEHKAFDVYLRKSSSAPTITLTPEIALVISQLIAPHRSMTKDDYEVMILQGFPSKLSASKAYGVDRKTITKKLEEYELFDPWKNP